MKRRNISVPLFRPFVLFFKIFSPQIAVQVANDISQFQQSSNNGVQSDETSNRTIKTSDLISWSFQIARGMEFLASKKVTDRICCPIQ
jgi:hypothetical protein